jgi:hypothetical protein
MRIYNDTTYNNFLAEKRQVCINQTLIDLVPEFEDAGQALEENGSLSYSLFIGTKSVGRLVFPWMKGWRYEGYYFDAADLKEMSKVIYYWVGLWD